MRVYRHEYKVDPSSSQNQTLSLSSHCSHHPLVSPCHAQTRAQRGFSSSWLGPPGSSSSQHADPVASPVSSPGSWPPPVLLTGWPDSRSAVMLHWHMHSTYTLRSLQLLAPGTWAPLAPGPTLVSALGPHPHAQKSSISQEKGWEQCSGRRQDRQRWSGAGTAGQAAEQQPVCTQRAPFILFSLCPHLFPQTIVILPFSPFGALP